MPKYQKRLYRHLNQADRDRLQALRDAGTKQKEIAKILKVDPATISREIARNRRKYRKKKNIPNKNARYEAGVANHKTYLRRKYAKYQGKKINESENLRQYIIKKLKKRWNPDEISGRMKRDKKPFYASKTAIYEWLRSAWGQYYCQYLYSRKYYQKKQEDKTSKKIMIPHRIGIEERPLGAENRSRYGHWEGDAMVSGKKHHSKKSLAVIYERKAKYIGARKIPSLAPANFNQGIKVMEKGLARLLSLTLDNGIENRNHEQLSFPAFFCDPYSSWQKGGVEGAIKMIRRFIPKGVDIGKYSDDYIERVIDILNHKPRKSLKYQTPYEAMVENNLFKNKKIPVGEIALRG